MFLTEIPSYISCSKVHNVDTKNKKFSNIFTNTQDVKKNSIYAIKASVKLRKEYINYAIQKGAVAIISDKLIQGINITQYVVKDINLSVSTLLKKIYPFKPLNSVAITGTNGKTSVVWYIAQISFLNKIPTKSYGTLGYYINLKKKIKSRLTTPEFATLHQTAYSKKKNNYNYLFEASSHGIDQNRLKNFPVNIAAITNITQDHLDYHLNFQNYKNTKYKLFSIFLNKDGYAILNDKIKEINFLKKKLSKKKLITYGSVKSDINIISNKKKFILNFLKKNILLIH